MKGSKTTKKAARRRPRTESKRAIRAKQTIFLKALRETGTVSGAIRCAKIDRTTRQGWLETDLTYVPREEAVEEELADEAEEELRRRALVGIDEPVYYRGEKIDVVKRRSEPALMFLLKVKRPEWFRMRGETSGERGHDPIAIDSSRLTDDELDQLRGLVRKATGRDEETGCDHDR